jgi:outer membrane lipoprotein-sorting protein
MKRLMICSLVACGLVLVGGSTLRAGELPTAESILDKEAEAVGGKAVNEKVKTVVLKAKLSAGDMNLNVLQQLAPSRYRMEVTDEGLKTVELVMNGNAVWKTSSITGAEVLEGADRSTVIRQAAELAGVFQRVGNWRKQFKDAKCVAEETVEGKAAYKVELTTRDGQTRVDHYDKDSGLLLRTETAEDTSEGKVNKIELYSDYRKVDGIMHAFTVRMQEGPAEAVVTIAEIKHNVDIPESTFAPPAEIKKQLEQ